MHRWMYAADQPEKICSGKPKGGGGIKTDDRMAKEPKIEVFRQSHACYGIDERAFLNPATR
jgi:hypothetical protein